MGGKRIMLRKSVKDFTDGTMGKNRTYRVFIKIEISTPKMTFYGIL